MIGRSAKWNPGGTSSPEQLERLHIRSYILATNLLGALDRAVPLNVRRGRAIGRLGLFMSFR